MRRSTTTRIAVALAALSGAALLLVDFQIAGRPAFPLDDSWIHLQFARRLAAGDGLAYSGAEWVTGSTAPLWTALLSLGFLLPDPLVLLWPKLLGGLGLLGTVLAAVALARALGLGRLAGLAGLLVTLTPRLLWSSASGMEILLFSCLALSGMACHVSELRHRDRLPVSGLLLAIAVLARPEGALLWCLAMAERVVRKVPGTGLAMAASALVLVPTLAFYRLVGGSFVPATFAVKAGAPLDPWPSIGYLRVVLDILVRSQPVLLFFAAAGASLLVARLGTPLDRGLLPAGWLLGQSLVYALLAAPPPAPPPVGNFGRYYFPLLPIVVVLGLLALSTLERRLRRLFLGPRWCHAWNALVAGVLVVQGLAMLAVPASYAGNVADVEASDVAAAAWLGERLDPAARVAVQDAGALAYFLPNPVVDLVGLVTPSVRQALHGDGADAVVPWELRLERYLRQADVDYLVVFADNYPYLTGRAPGFRRVRSFHLGENRTMAGKELVVVATPWCRFPLAER